MTHFCESIEPNAIRTSLRWTTAELIAVLLCKFIIDSVRAAQYIRPEKAFDKHWQPMSSEQIRIDNIFSHFSCLLFLIWNQQLPTYGWNFCCLVQFPMSYIRFPSQKIDSENGRL